MSRRIILDVSSYQGGIDFERIKRESPEVCGVIIKATEGPWPGTNPSFDGQYASARRAGLAVGFYCFDHMSTDPVQEAELYLQRVAGKTAELGHWLDFEANDTFGSNAQVEAHMKAWLDRVSQVYPMKAGVYTGAYFPWSQAVNLTGHALWLAAYTASIPWTAETLGRPLLMWQFTDSYPTYYGSVDGSVFLGTEEQWQWLTTGLAGTVRPNGQTGQLPTAPKQDKDPILSALPNITADDHTHPKALQLWRDRLKAANPAVSAKTDADWKKATEEFRGFLSALGGKPEAAPRIGEQMWAAVLAFSVTEAKK